MAEGSAMDPVRGAKPTDPKPSVLDPETCDKLDSIRQKFSGIKEHSKEWVHCGEWLKTGLVHYTGPDGKKRTWEMVERTNTGDGADSVDILATSGGSRRKILLVAVYRPPVNRVSLELPSGLVDPGETLGQAALRELVEETGHKGTITSVGPPVHLDPWKSTETTAICTAELADAGKGPLTLDDDEFLEPLELPLENLASQLECLQKEYGIVVDARLYYFALGLNMTKKE